MQLPFTGRASKLEHIDNLIRDKQCALFAVTGNAGMGKSTLLTQIAAIHKDKGQVFIDINDVPPIQTAVEFLQYFAKHAQGLKHTKIALTKINGTYKTTADLIAPYQSLLQDTIKLGFDEQSEELELTADETGKLTTLVKSLLQLFSIWSKSSQEKNKDTLGDPELFLLKALQQDCKNQPLIFIDTYERLQAAQTLSQQKISSLYSKPHERLTPVEAKLSLQDWLERLLPFLKQSGAIIVLAGRKTGCWHGQSLERFNDEDIANVVGNSDYADLQALLVEEQTQHALLTVLKRLSFDGIPLWLQLAINFVSLELMNGRSLEQLATLKNLDELFTTPESGTDLSSANIDNASCKLALFQRVMQHNLDLADEAWKMALPRRLNKQVLQILFAEQSESMRDAFTRAGLLPSVRWLDDTTVRLHEEIRDLLLAYAKYKKWLELEQTKALHKQLAETAAQRHQQTTDIQFLLERLYHSLMSEETSDLELIKDPEILNEMAMDLDKERQYVKMSQVLLRLIDIRPNHEIAWYGLGIALVNLGKLAEAEAAYRKQIEIKPDHEYAWNSLGNALSEQGKLVEAEAAYRKLININPDHEYVWNGLGHTLLRQQGKLAEAEAAFRKQIDLKPDNEHAWCGLGNTLSKQGKLEPAQQTYIHALEINLQNIFTLSNDAELALVQNDKARCLQRIASISALVNNKSHIYVILPFLAWLAEPESTLDAIYQAIAQLDNSVKIGWDFSDTEPAILRLTPEQQSVARQFIAYFQGTGELPPKPSN